MDPDIRHDASAHRFSVTLDGLTAVLLYAPAGDGVLDFQSTYVPDALRERGLGARLVRYALDHARANGLRVIPSCWFVKRIAERDPAYRRLLV